MINKQILMMMMFLMMVEMSLSVLGTTITAGLSVQAAFITLTKNCYNKSKKFKHKYQKGESWLGIRTTGMEDKMTILPSSALSATLDPHV